MKTLTEQFMERVENYLTQSGMDATSFGRDAMNDSNFVFSLRKGRSPSSRTMDRVLAWMRNNPVEGSKE